MVKILNAIYNWWDLNADSLTILAGGLTGALWKANLIKVMYDLFTWQHLEGAIIVGIKAVIGASIAYIFKSICNHFKIKRLQKQKNQNGKSNNVKGQH